MKHTTKNTTKKTTKNTTTQNNIKHFIKKNPVVKIVCVLAVLGTLSFLYWWFFINESSPLMSGGSGNSSSIGSSMKTAVRTMTGGGSRSIRRNYLNLETLNSTIKKFNSLIGS